MGRRAVLDALGAVWAIPGDVAAGRWAPPCPPAAHRAGHPRGARGARPGSHWTGHWRRCRQAARATGQVRGGHRRARPLPPPRRGEAAARALPTDWLRDPRYSASLLMIPGHQRGPRLGGDGASPCGCCP
ncbi:hypothetical protein QJS66_00385 [Kocuria rhizophila]|nr:hypothetical protein QJS66_00385 [Kocuria rhizophila]